MVGLYNRFDQSVRKCAKILTTGSVIMMMALSLVAGSAWSFEQHGVQKDNRNVPAFIASPEKASASLTGSCESFLKSVNLQQDNTSFDESNRRAAGKAAALGLVFGVRFALGPKEISPSKDITPYVGTSASINTSKALAIADYRRCKNEQALRTATQAVSVTIPNWRWMR